MGLRMFLQARRVRRLLGRLPAYAEGQGHVVQVSAAASPAGAVAAFTRQGAAAGEVGVVIATPDHVAAADALLGDLRARVVYLDADEMLARFMVDGHPDRQRFLDTVGDVVQQAAEAGGGRVRAYGEMVVRLCQSGRPDAAVELEGLGNELARDHALRLLCSYPVDALGGGAGLLAQQLRDTHSHALAEPPTPRQVLR